MSFVQAGSVDITCNGEIWVMGMSPGRVSIFDSTGTYLRGERTNAGGRIIKPYPRRVRRHGPLQRHPPAVTKGMARFGQSFNPIDTVPLPENPVEGEYFERLNEDGRRHNERVRPVPGLHDLALLPDGDRVGAFPPAATS